MQFSCKLISRVNAAAEDMRVFLDGFGFVFCQFVSIFGSLSQ